MPSPGVLQVKDARISFTVMVAGILLSAVLVSQFHFHDQALAEASCTACLLQANLDIDLDSSVLVSSNKHQVEHPVDRSCTYNSSHYYFAKARGPPSLLVS